MKKYPYLSIAALISVLLLLVGNEAMAASQPKPEGELVIVFSGLWNEAIDPILASGAAKKALVSMYDSLVGSKPDGSDYSKETGVAKDWELSADGKVWTFYLRKGIQFHRGYGELTAEDVKFCIDRISSPKSVSHRCGYFRKHIGKVEVVDRYTVKVHAKGAPIPDLMNMMSLQYDSNEQFIYSKRAVEEMGEDAFSTNPVGSGPYRFVELFGGQYIKLEAVEDHWRIGNPRFKTVYFRAVPEEETAIAMLARGDADFMFLSRKNIKRAKEKGLGIMRQPGMNGLDVFIFGQYVPGVPASNEKVREALNLAIDRQAIVDTVFLGMGRPKGTWYTTTVFLENIGYNWKEDLYTYDPEKARRLLAEAGYPNGCEIDCYLYPYMTLVEGREIMQIVAGMWSQVGVRPNIIPVDYGIVRNKLFAQKLTNSTAYWAARPRSWRTMLGYYSMYLHSKEPPHFMENEEMDRMVEKATESLDEKVSIATLKKIIKYVRKHHHTFPIAQCDDVYAFTKKAAHWNPGKIPNDLNLDSMWRQ